MSTRIAISQPFFFPWVGTFEIIQNVDYFLHYDDACLPGGNSFINRVQIKTQHGPKWLTVPIHRQTQLPIAAVQIDYQLPWRNKHLQSLRQSLAGQPYQDWVIDFVAHCYQQQPTGICELNISAIESLSGYLNLQTQFLRTSQYPSSLTSNVRLIELIQQVGADIYVTAHGARDYLDHTQFNAAGITVEYAQYQTVAYPQKFPPFTPYVSILDCIAATGPEAHRYVQSASCDWRAFLAAQSE